MKKWAILAFLNLVFGFVFGQDQQIANAYYSKGEYEKALPYYEKIVKTDASDFWIQRYVTCLLKLEDFDKAEKVVQKIVRNDPSNYDNQLLLGDVMEKNGKKEEADKHYAYLIRGLSPNSGEIMQLYNAFKSKSKYDYALQTLEKGRKALGKNYPLNFQFAEIYALTGKAGEMFDEFIGLIDINPSYKYTVQNILENYMRLDDESSPDYELLQQKLIDRIQKNPNEKVYPEMLIWLYLQKKDFVAALLQTKALDKRFNEEGMRVLSLGMQCVATDEYKTAKKCFQYVIELGEDKPFFAQAKIELLHAGFMDLTVNKNFTVEELQHLLASYQNQITALGADKSAYSLKLEYAQILAFYANNPQQSIKILESAVQTVGISSLEKAKGKLLLADVDVLSDDIWNASLLYMQVENDFKYDPIGHEAKFKNARIFYYDGEFEYAQAQLNILKASTSKLIANDAMKLSLFITDNLGIDSNLTAMRQFAKADLLLQQHLYNKAFESYDSILTYFPFHGLADDVLMRKADAYREQGKWMDAIELLKKVYTNYGSDILADDAVFQLAQLYEKQLKDKQAASEWYKKILFEYKGSLHVDEARKKFRELSQGDATKTSLP